MVDILPEDSIVTTISRYNRASLGDQNRQAEPVITGVRQNRAVTVEQYVPVSKVRSALNLQLQKEIAAIQGKTFQPSVSPVGMKTRAGGSNISVGLFGLKPVPSFTAVTLNERFSMAQ